jgi:hypothetical protein
MKNTSLHSLLLIAAAAPLLMLTQAWVVSFTNSGAQIADLAAFALPVLQMLAHLLPGLLLGWFTRRHPLLVGGVAGALSVLLLNGTANLAELTPAAAGNLLATAALVAVAALAGRALRRRFRPHEQAFSSAPIFDAGNRLDPEGLLTRLPQAWAASDQEEAAVVAMVKKYFDELHVIEQQDAQYMNATLNDAYNDANNAKNTRALEASIAKQRAVHAKFWCNAADFYQPISQSSDPAHDWTRIVSFKVLRNGDDDGPLFLFLYTYSEPAMTPPPLYCLGIRLVSDKPMIDHFYF